MARVSKAKSKSKTSKKKTTRKTAKKKVAKKAARKPVAKKAVKKAAAKKSIKKTAKKVAKKAATTTRKPRMTQPSLEAIITKQDQTIQLVKDLSRKLSQVFTRIGTEIGEIADDGAKVMAMADKIADQAPSAGNDMFGVPETNAAPPAVDMFSTTSNSNETVLTMDHAKEALQRVSASPGALEAVKEVLAKFKAERLSEVKEADYANFITACDAVCTPNTGAASTAFL